MRKRILLLTLVLAALAGALAGLRVEAGETRNCRWCTTYSDGSRCCLSCICDSSGIPIACTNNYCPPPDGGTN